MKNQNGSVRAWPAITGRRSSSCAGPGETRPGDWKVVWYILIVLVLPMILTLQCFKV